MNRTAIGTSLALFSALTLTACQMPAPDDVTAQVACEDLVNEHLKNPDDATYDHRQTTQDGDRWQVRGIVRAENSFGGTAAEQYVCNIEFTPERDYTGTVAFVTP